MPRRISLPLCRCSPARRVRSPVPSPRRCCTPTRTTSPRASGLRGAPPPGPSCAAATASATTPAPTRTSHGRWSAQPPFAVTDTRIGTAVAPLPLLTVFTTPSLRRPPTITASTRITRLASCRRGTPTSRATSGRSGTSAPTIRTPVGRASTSSAPPTAVRADCESKAFSHSSGSHPKEGQS